MTKTFEINGNFYSLNAWYYETRHNWGHRAEFRMPNGYSFEVKIVYYNRTWESYRYQSVMQKAVREALNDAEFIALGNFKMATGARRVSAAKKAEIVAGDALCNEIRQIYSQL